MPTHNRRGHTRRDGTQVSPATVTTQGGRAVPASQAQRLAEHAAAVARGEVMDFYELTDPYNLRGTHPSTPGHESHQPQRRPTPYHRRFQSFRRGTVEATRQFLNGPRNDRDAFLAGARDWVRTVSAEYNMTPPVIRYEGEAGEAYGYGCYSPADHEIVLRYPSRMTVLHEFRHAMQHQPGVEMVPSTHGDIQIEEDARAWSMSLFAQARPRLFERLVAEGRVLHVEPEVAEQMSRRYAARLAERNAQRDTST